MRCQHTGEFIARIDTSLRRLAREQKRRSGWPTAAPGTEHAVRLGVIAGSEIVHQEMDHHRGAFLYVRYVASLTEKRGLSEKVRTSLSGEINVHLLQMCGAIVTRNA